MGIMDIFTQEKILKRVEKKNKTFRFIIYLISTFFVALFYNLFFVKYDLVIGGMSGLAIVIKSICGLNTTVFILLSTVVLLGISFLLLGVDTAKRNVVGALIFPIFTSITAPLANMIHIEFDSFLFTVSFATLGYSIFLGIIYKVGYSTGGGDIINQIICKYAKTSVGQAGNYFNLLVIFTSVFVLGIPKAIYAVFSLLITNKIVDFIILGNSDSKFCIIKTKNIDYIEDYIGENFNIGYSVLNSVGGTDKKKRRTLMCVVTSREYYRFKNLILDIDPKAFFITHDCYEVLGGKQNKLIKS